MVKEFMTSQQVAEALGVTRQTVMKLVRAGRLPAIVMETDENRTLTRFRRSDVDQWIDERTVGRR